MSNEDHDRKLPSKPSPKRKQSYPPTSLNDFNARTVHQVSGFMVNGSPATQQAALAVLDNISSSSKNISTTLVQSAVDRGSLRGHVPRGSEDFTSGGEVACSCLIDNYYLFPILLN